MGLTVRGRRAGLARAALDLQAADGAPADRSHLLLRGDRCSAVGEPGGLQDATTLRVRARAQERLPHLQPLLRDRARRSARLRALLQHRVPHASRTLLLALPRAAHRGLAPALRRDAQVRGQGLARLPDRQAHQLLTTHYSLLTTHYSLLYSNRSFWS